VKWQEKAIKLFTDAKDKENGRERLELYRSKKPYHNRPTRTEQRLRLHATQQVSPIRTTRKAGAYQVRIRLATPVRPPHTQLRHKAFPQSSKGPHDAAVGDLRVSGDLDPAHVEGTGAVRRSLGRQASLHARGGRPEGRQPGRRRWEGTSGQRGAGEAAVSLLSRHANERRLALASGRKGSGRAERLGASRRRDFL
jgi:hypothetical protein